MIHDMIVALYNKHEGLVEPDESGEVTASQQVISKFINFTESTNPVMNDSNHQCRNHLD